VEYITDEGKRGVITEVALRLLKEPRATLDETIDEVAAVLAEMGTGK
jgi:hypothetical protein